MTSGGLLVSITDALSHVTNIKTATGGFYPKKIKDQNSVLTTLSWTPRNWLSSSVLATSAGNLTTSFTYDSAGNLTKKTLPDNSYLSYGYDNAHRRHFHHQCPEREPGHHLRQRGRCDADALEERQQRDEAPAHGDL